MVKKIPSDDPRARSKSSNTRVDRDGLIEFVTGKNRWVLATTRSDGRPQMSLVTGTITPDGDLLISSYPSRVKVVNAKRNPQVSVAVMGDEFNAAWVQIDGEATVADMPSPEASDGLVEYFRCIRGEHPDWDEYRQAMIDDQRCIVRFEILSAGPDVAG